MAKQKKNTYKVRAKKKGIIQHMSKGLETKGNVKNTLLETGKDLVVGVIGGGLIGAAIGKASLGIGALVTGAGHYANNKMATIFGVGMMAANGFQKGKSISGLDGLDGVKERVQAYKETFSEKLFIDKLIAKKTAAVNGMGNVQYFNYPNDVSGDLAALDYIENQITESGMQQMQASEGSFANDITGMEADEIIL